VGPVETERTSLLLLPWRFHFPATPNVKNFLKRCNGKFSHLGYKIYPSVDPKNESNEQVPLSGHVAIEAFQSYVYSG
jgi:hypothetical protein